MSQRDEQLQEFVCQRAADWFIANREGLDARQEAEFTQWLRASPMHVQEYLGMALTARDLTGAAAESLVPIDSLLRRAQDLQVERLPFPARRGTQKRLIPTWGFAAAALALAGLLAVGVAWWAQDFRAGPRASDTVGTQHFDTRHGQRSVRHLNDGSTVHLNTDTAVSIDISAHTRRVTLERGQATFEVAHDPHRPFRVITPAAEMVDVGTTFDVYMRSDATLVTVVAGRVAVEPGRAQSGQDGHPHAAPLIVGDGQQLRVVEGTWPGVMGNVDVGEATAWLNGRITFSQHPLGAVVAEFNRYNASPIVIETPGLRALPISGTFAVDDSAAFVAFLRSLQGTHVEVTSARTRVWQ